MRYPLTPCGALCHPPPLINASCGASQCAGVPAALMVTSPSYRICDGPPHPPSSWPGSGTSSVLPHSPARPGGLELQLWASATCLVVQTLQSGPWLVLTVPWLFRCSSVHMWAPALCPLSPLPLYIMNPLYSYVHASAFSPLPTTLPLFTLPSFFGM